MSLVDIYNCWAGESGTLRAKFVGACLKAAYAIANEAPETENHADRLVWAQSILTGTHDEVHAKAMVHLRYAMASNASLQASGDAASDGDVEFIVNSQIDIIAG